MDLVEKSEPKQDLQHQKLISRKLDLFQPLSALSKNRHYDSMFDYYKSVVAELGEDRAIYTMDFANVLWKFQQWREQLPKVKMFYAIKANPDPFLLRLLVILGVNFDCASEGEIRAALTACASPSQIIFANPNATPRGLKYAKKVGVDMMTFDSEEQLNKINKIYPRARLLLRFCPSEAGCGFDFREKFGCRLEKIPHLLETAKGLGMTVVGVSFHVGSLNTLATAFISTIRDARKIFDCAHSLGFRFSMLDIGGGFLGSIGTDSAFQKIARSIRESLSTHFPMDDVQVFAEPGCYVVCSAVTLTTTIFAKRTIRQAKGGNPSNLKKYYFLNNGIYSSFSPGIEQYNIFLEPLLSKEDLLLRPRFVSSLYGQTLCPMDVIKRDVVMPDMRVGESIVWKNMGAYSQSMCSRFCGFPLPDSNYVFRKNSRLNADRIKNWDEIARYLSDVVHVVAEEDRSVNDDSYQCSEIDL